MAESIWKTVFTNGRTSAVFHWTAGSRSLGAVREKLHDSVEIQLVDTGKPRVCAGKGIQAAVMDNTVVEIITDKPGLTGIGEVCPYPKLIASYANGVRCAIREFGPSLIGQNPLEIEKIRGIMDRELQGHMYAKAPIDIALWDIFGKFCRLPIAMLLGQFYGEDFDLYYAVPADSPDEMAKHVTELKRMGFKRFQIKVGNDKEEDIRRLEKCRAVLDTSDLMIADANGGWLCHEAIQVANSISHLDCFIEQPCESYEDCMKVRQKTSLPFILDESINSLDDVLRVIKDENNAMIGLKISKMGGISQMRQCRDLCVRKKIPMKIDTAWGSEITQAALFHMAHSTPDKYRLFVATVSPFNDESIAKGLPEIRGGKGSASNKHGLGLELNYEVLGEPDFIIS